jgi:hypothetical protein
MSTLLRQWNMRPLCVSSGLFVVSIVATISFLAISPVGARSTSAELAAGRTYADSLFSKIPIPSGVTRLVAPIKPLHPVTGSPGYFNVVDVVRYYRAPSSINVTAFSESHFPKSEWQGNGSTFDGGYHASASFSAISLCPDRHAAYCGVTYSAVALTKSQEELRIDVAVVWGPIHVVLLPTSGVVTLMGYDKISLMNPSSDPVQVELSATQVRKLQGAIVLLRSSPGGLCMEDSMLYKISVAPTANGKAFWSATADECPGQLSIRVDGHQIVLNARSCPLEKLVGTFFPPQSASGTKLGLKVCEPSG